MHGHGGPLTGPKLNPFMLASDMSGSGLELRRGSASNTVVISVMDADLRHVVLDEVQFNAWANCVPR